MTQKILRVGTSAAVTIPKKSLADLGLKIGDQVRVEVDRNRKSICVTPAVKVEKELVDWTERFIEKYRPALEALAKK
jgi:putative addiction module antidote